MEVPRSSDPRKETVFIHELSPELAEELIRRARENGHDAGEEAAEIIQRHIEDDGEADC